MELTELQRAALEILRARSVLNPITGKEVANMIGLKPRSTGKDGADMRSIINALRVKGFPVCATGNGYWWPRDRVELEGYINSFQGRIDDQQHACDGLKLGLKDFASIEVPPRELSYMVTTDTGVRFFKFAETRLKEFLTKYPKAVPYK